ncbi:hypothetical protein MRX96_020637 [Rhipicephalus microplus]|uniref:Putative conserved secreted protein n=1 Tax=Rhipicephalus microplus TaxID=6941 RepID=A0A6G4ZWY3_RHIMP
MASASMRLATPVLLVFLLAEVTTPNPFNCRPAKSLMNVDWRKLEKKFWIQALVDKPHRITQCIARRYRAKQGQLDSRAIGGTELEVWNTSKTFRHGVHNRDTIRFPKSRRPHFFQILDTDYKTYLVENNCNKYRGNVVSLMYHKPVKHIPEQVMKKTSAALLKSGLGRILKLSTTDCMLSGKGISKHIGPWFNISVSVD